MGRGTAFLVGGATAIALALGGLVGGVLTESPAAGPSSPVAPVQLSEQTLAGTAGDTTAAMVAGLEQRVHEEPGDPDLLDQLGFAYQLRWRETADSSYLPLSDEALRRALRARPGDPTAVLGLGSLALIQHRFRAALEYGRRASRLLPGSSRPYGVIGDAFVELGRYPDAFAAFGRMVSLRPSVASYARVSYARELTGDRRGALAAMRLAFEAAGGQPEPTAWTLVEISKLELNLGRPRAAERHLHEALDAQPGYPAAQAELALVEAARGRFSRAVAQAERAAAAVPTMQAVSQLSALLDRVGRHRAARRQRALVAVIGRLLATSGVKVDLESAVYRADYGISPRSTVALARRARAERPSIYGDDALAWALARAGRCSEALPLAHRALRLGTVDPLLYFHLGYAEGCAGDRAAMRLWYGRALSVNPEFSIRWAPVARRALAGS